MKEVRRNIGKSKSKYIFVEITCDLCGKTLEKRKSKVKDMNYHYPCAMLLTRGVSRPSKGPLSLSHRNNISKGLLRYRGHTKEVSVVCSKLKGACKRMLQTLLRMSGNVKTTKTCEALGYTTDELKQHLEKQFKPGMSWDNYGFRGWHIDHIKPIAQFVREGITDPKVVNALSNLQPLWAHENLSKRDNY